MKCQCHTHPKAKRTALSDRKGARCLCWGNAERRGALGCVSPSDQDAQTFDGRDARWSLGSAGYPRWEMVFRTGASVSVVAPSSLPGLCSRPCIEH